MSNLWRQERTTILNPKKRLCNWEVEISNFKMSAQVVDLFPGWDSHPNIKWGSIVVKTFKEEKTHKAVITVILHGVAPNTSFDFGFYQLVEKYGSSLPMLVNGDEKHQSRSSGLKNPLGPFTRENATVGPYNGWKIGVIETDTNGNATKMFADEEFNAGNWRVQFFLTPPNSTCPCYQSSGSFGSVTTINCV